MWPRFIPKSGTSLHLVTKVGGCQKRLRWKSGATFSIWILLLGAFKNYVVKILSFFAPPPLLGRHFLYPERILILLILTKVDKQAAAIASPSPFWLMVPCDPALKAINPNIKMKPPRDMCGMEWPEMNILSLSLKRSMRGPRIIAPERRRHHSFNSIHQLHSFRCTRVRLNFIPPSKGQLISKCLLGDIGSTKKSTPN